jgi:hypothetical protein
MLTKILLPHRFQKIGWIMILPFSVLLFAVNYLTFELSWLSISNSQPSFDGLSGFFDPDKTNYSLEFALIGVFLALFLIAFSKEKQEDEYIQKLRLDSLLVAFYANTFILILGTLLFYGFGYLEFMGYNMFTIQIIFIARFKWILYQQRKSILAF